jgi:hypothetical protein
MSHDEGFATRWQRLEAAYFARVETAIEPFSGWRDRFRAAATETARLVEAHPDDASFLAVESLAAGEVGRRCRNRLASRVAAALDTARAELSEPELVPEATSGWIVAIFFARVHRRCTRPDGPDLPSQLPELMFLAVSAYFGTEAGLEELV